MVKKVISMAAIILPVALLGWALSESAAAQGKKPDYVIRGQKLYNQNCAACHGVTGKGEGPVAKSLKGNVPDLTLLQAPGEKFPFFRVQTSIDGEKAVEPHGTREMPVWGTVFRKSHGDLQKQGDIYALVKYIETIQRGNK